MTIYIVSYHPLSLVLNSCAVSQKSTTRDNDRYGCLVNNTTNFLINIIRKFVVLLTKHPYLFIYTQNRDGTFQN